MPETTSSLFNHSSERPTSAFYQGTSYDRGNSDAGPTPDPMLDRRYRVSDPVASRNETGVPQAEPGYSRTSSWTAGRNAPLRAGARGPAVAAKVTVRRRWEGSVLEVGDGFFEARLTPTSDAGPDVIADISMADVAEDDIPLLRPGAPLHVTAGCINLPGGRVMPTSTVQVRRLGRWRPEEIALLEERAQKRRAALGFDDDAE